jgi:chemotaxis protein MotA
MDFATLAGLVAGVGFILLGQAIEGGHAGSLVQGASALIVFGGTLGTVLVAFPGRDLKKALRLLGQAFGDKKHDPGKVVKEVVELASLARRDGVLALESKLGALQDPFLRRAMQLLVDGVDATVARTTLETEIELEYEENAAAAKVYESAGGFAPTVGIIGAVLGLIHVMENLSDPTKLGPGIAVAFVATVYGVGISNLVLLPLANKLKRKLVGEKERKTLIAEGVLGIQDGLNPRVLEEKLRAFAGGHLPAAAPAAARK